MLLFSLAIAAATAWRPSTEGVGSACTAAVARYRSAVDALARDPLPPDFSRTVEPLEEAQSALDDAVARDRILAVEAPDAALRAAADACAAEADDTSDAALADPALFGRVMSAVRDGGARSASDRALERAWLARLRDDGALLAPAGRRELALRRGELRSILRAAAERPTLTLLARAVAARDRIAHLLGYADWAAYALAPTLLHTPARAEKLVEATLARTGAQGQAPARAVDPSLVAESFPLDAVLERLTGIYERLLGVTLLPATEGAWARGVRAYDVADAATGAPLGRLDLDLFAPADGGLPRGAHVIRPGRVVGAAWVPGEAVVRRTWPLPSRFHPSGLPHRRLRELVGDLGGGLALLLARTPYERLNAPAAGLGRLSADALERLAWDPTALARLAGDRPLSAPVLARLLSTRRTVELDALASEAKVAAADLQLASSGAAPPLTALWDSLDAPARAALIRDEGLLSMRLYARLAAADLDSALAAAPLDPATGLDLRMELFEPAQSDDPAAEIARVVGRPLDLAHIFTEDDP